MEPIITFLIGSVIGGILGNRADAAYCAAVKTVRERLQGAGKPINHDLQRAVRKAYLQATLALVEARFRELGVTPGLFQRDLRHIFHPSEETGGLEKAWKDLTEELRRLPTAAYVPPSPESEQKIELLLQPKGSPSVARVEEFKTHLKRGLEDELRQKYGDLPQRIHKMIQEGWQEDEEDNKLDWFDLLCAFFREELKQNQRVANILQSQILAQLVVEGVQIDWDRFTDQLETFSRPILDRLEQINRSLQSGFADLRDRIDELLPMLVILKDIQSQLDILGKVRKEREETRLPLRIRQAIAFEIAWLSLLWYSEYVQREEDWSRVAQIRVLTEKIGINLTYPIENYFTGESEDLMRFAQEVGGYLRVSDPDVYPYFETCWNMLIDYAHGRQGVNIPEPFARIHIPDSLREAPEGLLDWLNAIHAYFESIWQSYFRKTT